LLELLGDAGYATTISHSDATGKFSGSPLVFSGVYNGSAVRWLELTVK
jgi:hypothetical protein